MKKKQNTYGPIAVAKSGFTAGFTHKKFLEKN